MSQDNRQQTFLHLEAGTEVGIIFSNFKIDKLFHLNK